MIELVSILFLVLIGTIILVTKARKRNKKLTWFQWKFPKDKGSRKSKGIGYSHGKWPTQNASLK